MHLSANLSMRILRSRDLNVCQAREEVDDLCRAKGDLPRRRRGAARAEAEKFAPRFSSRAQVNRGAGTRA